MTRTTRLAVALDGAGWHPAAWREPSARPTELFAPDYWADLVRTAAAGGVDFVTIEDSLALQSSDRLHPDDRIDEVRGRLDATILANRLAPITAGIGLVPTVTTTYTEPFHVSTAIATLDFVSGGRAGLQAKLSLRDEERTGTGHEPNAAEAVIEQRVESDEAAAAFAEAAEAIEVVRRLWDSWEDDAEIRDAATDRFIDADKLHTIDYAGDAFTVRGPSIVPRSPQGQPVVTALAHHTVPYRFAAQQADVVFVTPDAATPLSGSADAVLAQVRDAERAVGRQGLPLQVYVDLVVLLDDPAPSGELAADRLARLDALGRPLTSDARIVAGSASTVADRIEAYVAAGYDGVRLRPGVATDDLPRIAADLVPELRRRELRDAAPAAAGASLREIIGLPAAGPSRYAGQTGRISPAPASAL